MKRFNFRKWIAGLWGKKRKQNPVERSSIMNFYDVELLENARVEIPFLIKEFPKPQNSGSTVEFRKFSPLVPSAPGIDLVRCKDCKYKTRTVDGEYNPEDIVCGYFMTDGLEENDYCSRGIREEQK